MPKYKIIKYLSSIEEYHITADDKTSALDISERSAPVEVITQQSQEPVIKEFREKKYFTVVGEYEYTVRAYNQEEAKDIVIQELGDICDNVEVSEVQS